MNGIKFLVSGTYKTKQRDVTILNESKCQSVCINILYLYFLFKKE